MFLDGEEVDQLNSDISSGLEDLQEAISSVELRLENGITPEKAVEALDEEYRSFSKIQESLDVSDKPEEALTPPEPTGRKAEFEPGDQGLKASEKKLSDHNQYLVDQIESTLQEAEEAYQKYREQKGLQRIDRRYNLRSMFKGFENEFESLSRDVQVYRNHLRVLRDVKKGERGFDETDFSIPEDKNEIDRQIKKASERVINSINEMQGKKKEVEEAVQELREDYKPDEKASAVKIGIKYGIGIEKVESYERWFESLEEDLEGIESGAKRQLPQEYNQKIEASG
ncbi:MAG: hypothetical protein ABEJ93_01855 [Candidatus Nanohalobium sp.]